MRFFPDFFFPFVLSIFLWLYHPVAHLIRSFDIFRYITATNITLSLSSGKELYNPVCFRSNPLYVYNYDMYSVYFVNLLNKIC